MMLCTFRLPLQDLLCITGSIDTARGDLQGYNGFKKSLQSAQEHNLEHEILTGDEVNARFPGYSLPSDFMVSSWPHAPAQTNIVQIYIGNMPHIMGDMHVQHVMSSMSCWSNGGCCSMIFNCLVHDLTAYDSHLCMAQTAKATSPVLQAVYQPEGGILASELCIAAHIKAAQSLGAHFHAPEKVEAWKVDDATGIVTIFTDQGQYTARKLVLTAGSWMPDIMPELQVSKPLSASVLAEMLVFCITRYICLGVLVLKCHTTCLYSLPCLGCCF